MMISMLFKAVGVDFLISLVLGVQSSEGRAGGVAGRAGGVAGRGEESSEDRGVESSAGRTGGVAGRGGLPCGVFGLGVVDGRGGFPTSGTSRKLMNDDVAFAVFFCFSLVDCLAAESSDAHTNSLSSCFSTGPCALSLSTETQTAWLRLGLLRECSSLPPRPSPTPRSAVSEPRLSTVFNVCSRDTLIPRSREASPLGLGLSGLRGFKSSVSSITLGLTGLLTGSVGATSKGFLESWLLGSVFAMASTLLALRVAISLISPKVDVVDDRIGWSETSWPKSGWEPLLFFLSVVQLARVVFRFRPKVTEL